MGSSICLGNIFDEDFHLLEQPLPCKVEYCICDHVYLVEERLKNLLYQAESYIKTKDFNVAGEAIKEVISLDNNSFWAYRMLAKLNRKKAELLKDYSSSSRIYLNQAHKYIIKALEINNADSWVNAEASRVYLAQGDMFKADEHINKALKKEFHNKDFKQIKKNIKKIMKSMVFKKVNNSKDLKVAIVLTPGWGRESPPYALALLSGILKNRGFKVNTFDLNNGLYHQYREDSKERQLWRWEQSAFWQNGKLVSDYINSNNKLIDSEVDKILETGAKVVGFSVYYSTKLMSLEFAKRIKQRDKNKIIVFGGTECQRKLNWQDLINEEVVDAVVLDDADESLPDFLNIIKQKGEFDYCPGVVYRKNGEIVDCGDRISPNLDILPFIDFSDFDFNLYECPDTIKIAFSRGCTERCAYCSARGVWRKFRTMSGERIFKELEYQANMYKKKMGEHSHGQIMFLDSLVNGSMKVFKEWVLKLADAHKDRNHALYDFNWSAQVIVRKEMNDREFLNNVRESGCLELNYGVESGSDKVLKDMRKRYDSKTAEEVVKAINNAGIRTKANFMFGFPTETEEDFQETMNFIKRNGRCISLIYPSRTFCALERFSYLNEHREEFGVYFKPYEHHLFWESQDGMNNYLVRLDRYVRFCKEVSKLKHNPLLTGVEDIERDKWLCVANYYKYVENFSRALDCYQKYLKLDGVKDSVSKDIELCKKKIKTSQKIYKTNNSFEINNKKEQVKKPSNFIFTITNRCNLRCRHCDIWKGCNDSEQELSIKEWKVIVKKIYDWVGKFNLIISGGEPLLKDNLVDLLSYCNNFCYTTNVSTNGSLLDLKKQEILDCGLDYLSVSLDSLSGIVDWSRREKGLNEKILNSLNSFLELEKRPAIDISTLLFKQNLNEIISIINWAKSKKIRFILNPLLENLGKKSQESNWYKKSIFWPDYNKASKVIDEIIDKKRNGFDNIVNPISQLEAFKYYYSNPNVRPEGYICSVGERNFGIGPYGNVHFCPITGNVGNILKDSPKDIWFSDKAEEAREKIKKCDKSCYVLGCYFK